jgi:pyruvate/2-oxoglutarate dehydrogenase complex dihydrolipoamide acyltransferase (E2) component
MTGDRQSSVEAWRKIALASWTTPVDPQIFGDIEVDAGALVDFLRAERERTGTHVTVTHLVGKALAHALATNPDVNVRLRRGRFVPREGVDVFFVVSISDGKELSGAKVSDADRKSVAEVADELQRRVERIRAGEEAELGSSKQVLGRTPTWLLRRGLRFATWLVADRGVSLRRFGLPDDAFGSAIVSSVSAFGAERAYGPLNPWYRVPVLVLVSEVRDKAVVVDGAIVARPMLTLSATLDHRYLDGAHAGRLVRSARAYLEDPAAFTEAGEER